jgi:hypothetical protein
MVSSRWERASYDVVVEGAANVGRWLGVMRLCAVWTLGQASRRGSGLPESWRGETASKLYLMVTLRKDLRER